MNKKYCSVISFIGKSGSGKSYLANIASEISGIPVYSHREAIADLLRMPIVNQIINLRMKCSNDDVENMTKQLRQKLSKTELFFAFKLLNFKMKRDIDPNSPIIVAAQAQPRLHIVKDFGHHNLVVGDPSQRLLKLAERDGITESYAAQRTAFFEAFYDFDQFSYEHTWHNNYKTLPSGFENYAESLKDLSMN